MNNLQFTFFEFFMVFDQHCSFAKENNNYNSYNAVKFRVNVCKKASDTCLVWQENIDSGGLFIMCKEACHVFT